MLASFFFFFKDIVDLSSGEDIDKFVDLFKSVSQYNSVIIAEQNL